MIARDLRNTTSVHLLNPVSTDLALKSDSVLINPIAKDGCEVGRCSKTSTPSGIFIVAPSLERWLSKDKEAPSPYKVRLALLSTKPVF